MGNRHPAGGRSTWQGRGRLERAAVFVGGLYLAGTGISHLLSDRLLYSNYLGAPMLAPLAIAAGAVLLVISLFAWSKLAKYF